jgi:hypothetical protein
MEVINSSACDVQVTQALDKGGQPWLVVIAKATYRIADDAAALPARLAPQQNPLLVSDLFAGEPGLSSPCFESDFVPFKAACDVVFKGAAHVPWQNGRAAKEPHVDVGLQVADAQGRPLIRKGIRVHGRRLWRRRLGRWTLGDAEPFASMPLSYEIAFGGTWRHEALGSTDPSLYLAHPMNLVGRGFAGGRFAKLLDGAPAHQTELWVQGRWAEISSPQRHHAPASLGPIARNWQPRLAFAGTYDQDWKDTVFPLPPADFDERFYQCAPVDQQMPHPAGGETVTLLHLTQASARNAERTNGLTRFRLPRRSLPIVVMTEERSTLPLGAVMDTIAIDGEAMCFDVTWRARMPLKRSLHEVHTVAVGHVSRRWWQERAAGERGCAGCGDAAGETDLVEVAA